MDSELLKVEVPEAGYHRSLISCQEACPVHTDARGYVRAIAAGRLEEAYLIARAPNPLASICGRVCGAPCEAACRRGKVPRVDANGNFVAQDRPIAIRALKRFACESSGTEVRPAIELAQQLREMPEGISCGDEEMAALIRAGVSGAFVQAAGEPIAIVGSGPAGLSAAHDLALMGFKPVIFESEPIPAGMLVLGIPAYRLPRDLIQHEVKVIEALGVKFCCGTKVGTDVSLAELRRDYRAVIIAVGAKSSRRAGISGEDGPSVFGGVDLLRASALGEKLDIGPRVVVIGGGNVAYDVARTVIRQIAYDTARTVARMPGTGTVHLVSLETLEEMPADTVEIIEGDEEGIQRHNGWGPVEIERDAGGLVRAVVLRRCLRVYDTSGRFSPTFSEQEVKRLECDTVLLSVGQSPDLGLLKGGGEDIEEMRPGWPKVSPETLATTAPGVFVAGDLAHGTRLLIDAVASGKKAARSVYEYVTGRQVSREDLVVHVPLERYRRENGYEKIGRADIPVVDVRERLKRPDRLVEAGYDRALASREASRCLDCGVTPVFDGTRCVLCGGCVDVCPTLCLKLMSLSKLQDTPALQRSVMEAFGPEVNLAEHSAIVKDEDRCIRCALCVMRCPADAITMERVECRFEWRSNEYRAE